MDHSVAIACLKDDLDAAKQDARYLAQGIAAMLLRNETGPDRIRPEVILRWRNNLDSEQKKVHALRSSIKFLEHHTTGGK